MSATIAINPSEIREIYPLRISNASRLWELAQKTNELAIIVEAHWEKITPETKQLLTSFAYTVIEPPKGIKGIFFDWSSRFSFALALPWIAFKRDQYALIAYYSAFPRLVNAIFSAIERKDTAYQQALSNAIEEAFTGGETREAMTVEDACQRIKQISEQAFREL